jgi:hypothetical protein
MTRTTGTLILALFLAAAAVAQVSRDRSGVFLHHSVGQCIWDRSVFSSLTPPTTVAKEIAAYNSAHGYTGSNAVSMTESYFPAQDAQGNANNNWSVWNTMFSGGSYNGSTIDYTPRIIVVKTCYIQQQSMTSSADIATLQGYIRSIIKVMAAHPNNFFVIWNNYPAATDGASSRAVWSAKFSVWMKDLLATGKDSYGIFPKNVYVFDVFRKLADGTTGVCPAQYGSGSEGPGGDHPSNAALAVITPAFVKETFDAALAYTKLAGVLSPPSGGATLPLHPTLDQNFPNPFNPSTTIGYQITSGAHVSLTIFDILGRSVAVLVDEEQLPGTYRVNFDSARLSSGVYTYRITAGSFVEAKRMAVVK